MIRLYQIFSILRSISIIKTLYFNLKSFSLIKAIHLPILVGKRVDLRCVGKVVLNYSGKKKIHIGSSNLFNTSSKMPTVWNNHGTVVFNGPVVLYPSTIICIAKNGSLEFLGNNRIGAATQILCLNRITFGEMTELSWNCQVCDSDFHFLRDLETSEVKPRTSPIQIGNNVWIGNHVIIGKGVSIADGCICGMNSMVTKSCYTPNTILIGIPAKPRAGKYARIFDFEEEAFLANKLG